MPAAGRRPRCPGAAPLPGAPAAASFQEAQPQPQREEPQLQPLLQEALANFGVYSGFAMRSGFRIVMGRSGSKRRKAAKVDAALGPVATVVGGIVVVIAIF